MTSLCTSAAQKISLEESTSHLTTFLTLDATTLKLHDILNDQKLEAFRTARIVYLFIYPTLLKAIKNILKEIMGVNEGLRIVTQNYHFKDEEGEVEVSVNVEEDGFEGLKVWRRLY